MTSVVWAAAILHEKRQQTVTEKRRAKNTPHLLLYEWTEVNLICAIDHHCKQSLLQQQKKKKKVTKFFWKLGSSECDWRDLEEEKQKMMEECSQRYFLIIV